MSLKILILDRIKTPEQGMVWTPFDFLDLGNRDAVDKVLQRLVKTNSIRRIDRGLYDYPKKNNLIGALMAPNYQNVIAAVSRRDQSRMLVDGLTSANDLGLTNAVPGQVNILTDSRLKPIKIGNLVLKFKHTAPSKLYWADRPAMRVVQALHWLRDVIEKNNKEQIKNKLILFLKGHPKQKIIVNDLCEGLSTLPAWMQKFLKELILELEGNSDE
ncbi:MAG: DUF6088 family protein [Legionella sp.]|nr:DUF6088 family protein [Legionella sp.]